MSASFLKKFGITVGALAGLVAAANFAASKAQASQWDKLTILTFTQPTQVSNTYLAPGTYAFKLVVSDSDPDRHIVQIFNQDQTRLISTVLANPAYRSTPANETEISFWETPAGSAKAVRIWRYPGDNYGQEFAYPSQLREVAVAAASPSVKPAQPQDANQQTPLQAAPQTGEPSR